MSKNNTVEDFIAKNETWSEILLLLRQTVLSRGLKETVKWGAPVYEIDGNNIVGLGAFKSYAGLWFFQGALLKDNSKRLINAQEGKTKAMRQWRFSNIDEVDIKLVETYVEEAISNQKLGKEIKPDKNKPLIIPDELNAVLSENEHAKSHFDQLSLSKKRDYAEYIQEAKREETKLKRLDKIIPMIIDGIGLNDKYKK